MRLNPYGRLMRPAEMLEHAAGADVIILGNEVLDGPTIDKLSSLKLVVRTAPVWTT